MSTTATYPLIIQGGMGIGVSNWVLARAVSIHGQLGVVSGTAIDALFVRRLQDGDVGGHMRRAMEHFPLPHVSADVLARYFLPAGREGEAPYRAIPMHRQMVTRARDSLTMIANFVEVFLAKEGHDGPVGLNLLTKVQMPTLPSLYGAMMAGVDYVLMGAGIPREVPAALDRLAAHEAARIRLDVEGRGEAAELTFDPGVHRDDAPAPLRRPRFLPIVSSDVLATMLARKTRGIDGFVIEGPTAGGHNAPPRGSDERNDRGEPVYGERDEVDLEKVRELGLPFWLAGGTGWPDRLERALDAGAAGVQVGTLFAYCDESGLDPSLRRRVLDAVRAGTIDVRTDADASPTGFPFKVVELEGSLSDAARYEQRERVCDLGYLRTAYRRDDGRLDYRCPAEPVATYVAKGGDIAQTVGRKCLCNALMANIGHGQARGDGVVESPLLTSGDDLVVLDRFLGERESYSAADAIDYLLAVVTAA